LPFFATICIGLFLLSSVFVRTSFGVYWEKGVFVRRTFEETQNEDRKKDAFTIWFFWKEIESEKIKGPW